MENSSFEDNVKPSNVGVAQPGPSTMNYARSHARVYETPHDGAYQNFLSSLGRVFGSCGVIPCCLCTNPYQNVESGYVGIITKFGAIARQVDAGSSYVNTWTEKLYRVPIFVQSIHVPSQACLTKDNVQVNVSSVIYYNIIEPSAATFGIAGLSDSLTNRTQATLRDVVGGRILQDVIEKREEIAADISKIISHIAKEWGVFVENISIKDISLPTGVSNSLSKAAEAQRIGEGKIIAAQAEVKAAKLMKNVADILSSSAAMQIRHLDAMQSMAKSSNSKVIFMPTTAPVDNIAGVGGANAQEVEKKLESEGFSQEEISKVLKLFPLQEALLE